MGARYYSPALGRFISRDPSGFSAGPNVYSYCLGDPVNFFDPDGCEPESAETVIQAPDDGLWGSLRAAGNFIERANAPTQQLLNVPLMLNVVKPLVDARDGMWRAGIDAGNAKGDPWAIAGAGGHAALAYGGACFFYAGTALAVINPLLAGENIGCFTAGTPVTTAHRAADGTWRTTSTPIERIRRGDLVLARDAKTGKTSVRPVLRTTVRTVHLVLTVTLADAKTHRAVETITATREHPFYVRGRGFVPAGGLAVGNAIVTRAGPPLVVASLRWQRRAEGYRVYNCVVEDDHSYFVGRAGGGAWVHNPRCIPQGSGNAYSVAYEAKISGFPGSRESQFQQANSQLLNAMRSDPEFAQTMDEMIPGIEQEIAGPRGEVSDSSPNGWTWHHQSEPGTMQLVPRSQHTYWGRLFHGAGKNGYSIWGR